MALADAYKTNRDLTIPRAIAAIEGQTLVNGEQLYETEGVSYPAGSYVLTRNISPPIRDAIERGDWPAPALDEVSAEEAEEAARQDDLASRFSTFVPEHEVEREALIDAGHTVVDRATALELASAGAEEGQKAQERAKAENGDERPNLTVEEGSVKFSESVQEGKTPLPKRKGHEGPSAEEVGSIQVTPSGVIGGEVAKDAAKHPDQLHSERIDAAQEERKAARRAPQRKKDESSEEGKS